MLCRLLHASLLRVSLGIGALGPLVISLHGQPPATGEAALKLVPIVVTAQKRGQAVDEVPISLAAFSGTSLELLGVTRFEDLAPLVPGMFVSAQSPANPSLNLRGIGSDSTDPRQHPRISTFLDGVAISRSVGSHTELFDLERVEVLKGPQGTLFGRSAGAGAISLISRKPLPGREARLTLGTGNHDRRHADGFVNTPLGSEQWLGRLAFSAERREGTTPNRLDGSTFDSRETVAVRPSLRWLSPTGTTVDLVVSFERNTPAGVGLKSGVIPTTRGDIDYFADAEQNRGPALGLERTVWGATLLVTHPLSSNWTLTSIIATRDFDSQEEFDIDGSRFALVEASDDHQARQLSQELRFSYEPNGGRFAGFAGLAFSRERADQRNDLRSDERIAWPFLSGRFRSGLLDAGVPAALVNVAVPVLNPFVPQTRLPATFAAFSAVPQLASLAALADVPLKPYHEEYATNSSSFDATDFFVDGSWRVTDRLEFTAGVRASLEQQTSEYETPLAPVPSHLGFILGAGANFAAAPTAGRLSAKDRDDGWTGRAVARYTIAPELKTYASFSRGRRPVAIVIANGTTTRSAEETIDNAELGAKGSARGERLAWSAAVFHYRYRHFQTFVQDRTNIARLILIDAGRATGRGGEISVRASLAEQVSAFATYGYTDATFDARGDGGAAQQYAGSRFRLTSRHTAAIGFTIERTFAHAGTFSLSPRWTYKSGHYFEDDNRMFGGSLYQPGYGLAHMRLAWRRPNGRWAAAAYVANLFDRDFLIDAGNFGASLGIPTFVRGEPRLLGFDLTRSW